MRVIKSGRMRWAGHVARMEDRRGPCRILSERCDGNRPVGRPRSRREENMEMDHQEVAQDRDRWRALVNVVIKCQDP